MRYNWIWFVLQFTIEIRYVLRAGIPISQSSEVPNPSLPAGSTVSSPDFRQWPPNGRQMSGGSSPDVHRIQLKGRDSGFWTGIWVLGTHAWNSSSDVESNNKGRLAFLYTYSFSEFPLWFIENFSSLFQLVNFGRVHICFLFFWFLYNMQIWRFNENILDYDFLIQKSVLYG